MNDIAGTPAPVTAKDPPMEALGEKAKKDLARYMGCFSSLKTTTERSRRAICQACIKPLGYSSAREITNNPPGYTPPPSQTAYLCVD